jgi:hypothetical protein
MGMQGPVSKNFSIHSRHGSGPARHALFDDEDVWLRYCRETGITKIKDAYGASIIALQRDSRKPIRAPREAGSFSCGSPLQPNTRASSIGPTSNTS